MVMFATAIALNTTNYNDVSARCQAESRAGSATTSAGRGKIYNPARAVRTASVALSISAAPWAELMNRAS